MSRNFFVKKKIEKMKITTFKAFMVRKNNNIEKNKKNIKKKLGPRHFFCYPPMITKKCQKMPKIENF